MPSPSNTTTRHSDELAQAASHREATRLSVRDSRRPTGSRISSVNVGIYVRGGGESGTEIESSGTGARTTRQADTSVGAAGDDEGDSTAAGPSIAVVIAATGSAALLHAH